MAKMKLMSANKPFSRDCSLYIAEYSGTSGNLRLQKNVDGWIANSEVCNKVNIAFEMPSRRFSKRYPDEVNLIKNMDIRNADEEKLSAAVHTVKGINDSQRLEYGLYHLNGMVESQLLRILDNAKWIVTNNRLFQISRSLDPCVQVCFLEG